VRKRTAVKKRFFIAGVESVEVALLEARGNADIYFGSKTLALL